MTAPYNSAALTYLVQGWPSALPLPAGAKAPVPSGLTGYTRTNPTLEQTTAWMLGGPVPGAGWSAGNIALRLPTTVVGIDVDQYGDKTGAATLAAMEQRLGALPPTWSSTRRGGPDGPGLSRVMLFTVPDEAGIRAQVGPSIEALRWCHRYIVVAPSVVDGLTYRWFRPDGTPAADGEVPAPTDLAALPQTWLDDLHSDLRELPSGDGEAFWQAVRERDADTPTCPEMAEVAARFADRIGASDSRYETMRDAVHNAAMLAAEGHRGLLAVLDTVADAYRELIDGDRGHDVVEGELTRAARGALEKAAGRGMLAGADSCALFTHLTGSPVPTVAPSAPGQVPAPAAEPAPTAPAVFAPTGATDAEMAVDVLAFHAGHARFAVDAGVWLHRIGARWFTAPGGTGPSYAKGLVAACGATMRRAVGDGPEVEAHNKARARLQSNAGVGAVAGLIGAVLARPGHPLTVEMGDLDDETELLWCNGIPYDLRASTVVPTVGRSRHQIALRDTGITPDATVPTPCWDRYIATVVPDPELRGWLLRLFGIAVTGEPDRALPILYGTQDSGKSSLIRFVMRALGGYAGPADVRLLGAGEHHGSLFLALKGLRMAYVDEGPRKGKAAVEKLKYLTGGTPLTGNAMRQDPVEFMPTHTLVMSSNDEPEVVDGGLRSRFRPVPCHTPRAEVVAALLPLVAAWETEKAGVLAQLMAQAGLWLADRSSADAPAGVAVELERMGREQDPVTDWLDERCTPTGDGGELTSNSDLYRDFRSWYVDSGRPPQAMPASRAWGHVLRRLGVPTVMGKTGGLRDTRCKPLALRHQVTR